MILIELAGERQLVESLEGYDDWTVVAEAVDPPPSDSCTFTDGAWIEDLDAKAAADRSAELNAMSRGELVAMIESLIADQAARISIVQDQVEAVAVAADVPAAVLQAAGATTDPQA